MDTLEEFDNATFAGQRVGDMTAAELKRALWIATKSQACSLEETRRMLDTFSKIAEARRARNEIY